MVPVYCQTTGPAPQCEELVNVFQTIVVGADNSPTALQAVQAAAALAQMSNGTLHIVSSHEPEQGPMRSEHGGYVDPIRPADELLGSLAGVAEERGLEPVLHPSSGSPPMPWWVWPKKSALI